MHVSQFATCLLGLRCLLTSHIWYAKHKWMKTFGTSSPKPFFFQMRKNTKNNLFSLVSCKLEWQVYILGKQHSGCSCADVQPALCLDCSHTSYTPLPVFHEGCGMGMGASITEFTHFGEKNRDRQVVRFCGDTQSSC